MPDDPTATTAWLPAQPTLTGEPPSLDLTALPDDPVELFLGWIRAAGDAGVAEPHAAALGTADAEGMPDVRMLILKAVDDRGWAFAGPRSSRKGAQLSVNPAAALSFWWQPQRRAVRVRGRVVEASPEETAADLAARSAAARDGFAADDWALWRIDPVRVEFWQGSRDRNHVRIVFERSGSGWTRRTGEAEEQG